MTRSGVSTSYSLKTVESFEKERARLKDQAKILFRLEKKIFESFMKRRGLTKGFALDLGCGNGCYLDTFLRYFSNWRGAGIEKNPSLLDLARNSYPNLSFKAGDINDSAYLNRQINRLKPNVTVLRFVLQHLSPKERFKIYKNLHKYLPKNALLIIIEPDDSEFQMSKKSNLVFELIKRSISVQASRGGDRTIARELESEILNCGWSNVEVKKYLLSNTTVGMTNLIKIMLPIWRTYDSPLEKQEIDSKTGRAQAWLTQMAEMPSFELSFPISVFCIEK
jgi:SAM-dependent methyltransferase